MKQTMYQIDAFTDTLYSGNPAAVCILEHWPAEPLMQEIAAENNLAETAFVVQKGAHYEIRWFTPVLEVDLCGHATLAAAFVLFGFYGMASRTIEFYSARSGKLLVEKGKDGLLVLDFPTDVIREITPNKKLNKAMGKIPETTLKGKTDYLLVYGSQDDIERLTPDFMLLKQVNTRGVIATSRGQEVDFVSRFFAPQSGIAEDPVTGSAHTSLIPYWSKILGKNQLHARQLSARGGEIYGEYHGDRVKIAGNAVLYMRGEIEL